MPRAVDGSKRKNRRKKLTKLAKGYWGRRKNLYRTVKNAVTKSLVYAYKDRKRKKRDFNRLWIIRISAACKNEGINYSSFILALKNANIILNKKTLAYIALNDPNVFKEIVNKARN